MKPAFRSIRSLGVPRGVLVCGALLAAFLGVAALAGAQQITYEYDALGRLTVVASPEGAARYEFDLVGNITRVTTRRHAEVPGAVAILIVSPLQGRVGTEVRLYGRGFDAASAQNQVTVGGVPAAVVAASPDRLVITVPAGAAGSGPITVTNSTGSAASQDAFTALP